MCMKLYFPSFSKIDTVKDQLDVELLSLRDVMKSRIVTKDTEADEIIEYELTEIRRMPTSEFLELTDVEA